MNRACLPAVLLATSLLTLSASAKTITVAPDGTGDVKTLQEADRRRLDNPSRTNDRAHQAGQL